LTLCIKPPVGAGENLGKLYNRTNPLIKGYLAFLQKQVLQDSSGKAENDFPAVKQQC